MCKLSLVHNRWNFLGSRAECVSIQRYISRIENLRVTWEAMLDGVGGIPGEEPDRLDHLLLPPPHVLRLVPEQRAGQQQRVTDF